MQSFRSLIEMWPSIAAFSRATGIGYEAAKKMRERGNIKHQYWPAIIRAARARGYGLTADDLLRMSKKTRSSRREKLGGRSTRAAA